MAKKQVKPVEPAQGSKDPNDQFLSIGQDSYRIRDLPPDIQQLLGLHQKCQVTLRNQQDDVFLTQISLKTLSTEIEMRVRAHAEASKVQVSDKPQPRDPAKDLVAKD